MPPSIQTLINEYEPANQPTTADIMDKDKHGRLIIGTKKWIMHVAMQAFEKYKGVHPDLVPTYQMDYPYVQKKLPSLVVYNVTTIKPTQSTKMIGYNVVQNDVKIDDKIYNVRNAQYNMTLGVDFWAETTFGRDAALDIMMNEFWISKRIDLGQVGIYVFDVSAGASKTIQYGEDPAYGAAISISLMLDILYFQETCGGPIVFEFDPDTLLSLDIS